MLPTPDTSHVSFDNVYEPAEDSFLFLDTLSSAEQVAFLHNRFAAENAARTIPEPESSYAQPSPLVVEIGPGSGVVLAFVAANSSTIFGRRDVLTLGVDVNGFACKATARTLTSHVTSTTGSWQAPVLSAVAGDLAACLRPLSVDVLLFNPPYVPSGEVPLLPGSGPEIEAQMGTPSAKFERDNHLLALATDGGTDGMEITSKLLEQLPSILSARGVAFVLLCAQNKPAEVQDSINCWNVNQGKGKWAVHVAGSSGKTGGWEKLQIIRIDRLSV